LPTLEITTTVGCPLDCTYCPQDQLRRNYGVDQPRVMSHDTFVRLLSKVPRYVRIDFSGLSEPWANPHCTSMLRRTLEGGYNVAIYTTLVGMRDPETVVDLWREYFRQVETVVLHLPDPQGNMRGFKRTPRYEHALATLTNFTVEEPRRVRQFSTMTMDPTSTWTGNDRAGNLDRSVFQQHAPARTHHRAPTTCSYTPFYDHNVVLPNGDVVLCCMDYGLDHKLGNLLNDEYPDLFESEGMSKLRRENTSCSSKGSICKTCDRATPHTLSPTERQFWTTLPARA
jgi:radical SAM protein with 4Fe4S-binding SPASM domain